MHRVVAEVAGLVKSLQNRKRQMLAKMTSLLEERRLRTEAEVRMQATLGTAAGAQPVATAFGGNAFIDTRLLGKPPTLWCDLILDV